MDYTSSKKKKRNIISVKIKAFSCNKLELYSESSFECNNLSFFLKLTTYNAMQYPAIKKMVTSSKYRSPISRDSLFQPSSRITSLFIFKRL